MSNSVCRPGATASPLSATITLSPGSCIAIYNTQHRAYKKTPHRRCVCLRQPPDAQWTAGSKLMVILQTQKCIWSRYHLATILWITFPYWKLYFYGTNSWTLVSPIMCNEDCWTMHHIVTIKWQLLWCKGQLTILRYVWHTPFVFWQRFRFKN